MVRPDLRHLAPAGIARAKEQDFEFLGHRVSPGWGTGQFVPPSHSVPLLLVLSPSAGRFLFDSHLLELFDDRLLFHEPRVPKDFLSLFVVENLRGKL